MVDLIIHLKINIMDASAGLSGQPLILNILYMDEKVVFFFFFMIKLQTLMSSRDAKTGRKCLPTTTKPHKAKVI